PEGRATAAAEQAHGRIARDLHDGLGQQLGGALFLSSLLQRDLKERGAKEADRAAEIHHLIEQALADARAISRGLYPVPPEPDGLMTALQNLADRVTRDCNIECCFDADSAVLLDDPATASHLYRLAQEAVNNAVKYSGSSRIDVYLKAPPHQIELIVRGQAGTARETMDAISRLKPDVLLMDLTLPDKEGLELIKDVQALHAGLPVVVCSMHDEAFYAARVLRAGARGYIMKSEGPEKLFAALRTVLSGQIALS